MSRDAREWLGVSDGTVTPSDVVAAEMAFLLVRAGGTDVTAVPYDPIVHERTRTIDGTQHASFAQVAIDCLSGFQRMPSEGEALLAWMRKNDEWRDAKL